MVLYFAGKKMTKQVRFNVIQFIQGTQPFQK